MVTETHRLGTAGLFKRLRGLRYSSQGCYNCSLLNELRRFTKNKTTWCDERGLVVALRRTPSEAMLWLCRISKQARSTGFFCFLFCTLQSVFESLCTLQSIFESVFSHLTLPLVA